MSQVLIAIFDDEGCALYFEGEPGRYFSRRPAHGQFHNRTTHFLPFITIS